ncbi:MAG TPA: DnaA/Hda family protein, partial [Rhabdochlamydiaceae bacterium]
MQAWEQFLKVQEAQLGAETVNKWLRSLKVLHFDACNLYVEAADSVHALWFEEHIRPHLRKTFLNNNHRLIKVHLSIAHDTPPAPSKSKEKQKPAPFTLCFDTLDPKATFENFVAPENSMAATFFQQLKKEQLGSYNPIYLYGPQGVGKTHLLMAAAHLLKKQGCHVLYVKAETFTEHVISAIRNSAMQEFRKAYRHVDVLILDDVHLFARRSATQEEFFHTFNTLHGLGRQIFLSAGVPPENLQDIEPRLISRFEWGLTLSLEKLEAAGLSQVLRRQLEALQFPLSAPLMQLLLDRLGNNSVLLRQAAVALVQRCRFTKTAPHALNPDSVKTILEDFLEEEKRLALNPQK